MNNAGHGLYAPLAEADFERLESLVMVNVVALTELTRLYLPQMLSRASTPDKKRILFVASNAGVVPGPFSASYFASKAYAISFAHALYEELRGTGVTVTCATPGAVNTNFATRAHADSVSYFKKGVLDATFVATDIYRAFMKGKRHVVSGLKNKLQAIIFPFAPTALAARMVRKMHGY